MNPCRPDWKEVSKSLFLVLGLASALALSMACGGGGGGPRLRGTYRSAEHLGTSARRRRHRLLPTWRGAAGEHGPTDWERIKWRPRGRAVTRGGRLAAVENIQ